MVHRFVLLLVESNQNKEVDRERLIFVTIYLVVVLKTDWSLIKSDHCVTHV